MIKIGNTDDPNPKHRNDQTGCVGGCVGGLKTQLAMTQLSFNLGQLSKEVQKLEHAKLDTWGLTREIFCLCMNLREKKSENQVIVWHFKIMRHNITLMAKSRIWYWKKGLLNVFQFWVQHLAPRFQPCGFAKLIPTLKITAHGLPPLPATTHRSQEAKCQQSKMCQAACLNYLTKKFNCQLKRYIYMFKLCSPDSRSRACQLFLNDEKQPVAGSGSKPVAGVSFGIEVVWSRHQHCMFSLGSSVSTHTAPPLVLDKSPKIYKI